MRFVVGSLAALAIVAIFLIASSDAFHNVVNAEDMQAARAAWIQKNCMPIEKADLAITYLHPDGHLECVRIPAVSEGNARNLALRRM